MRTDDLDFQLPPVLIAQVPPEQRTASRLLHYRRSNAVLEHRVFSELPKLLRSGDLLVFNDTRVLPARFVLQKSTGGRIDGLFVQERGPGRWQVLLRNVGAATKGELSVIGVPGLVARIVQVGPAGEYELELSTAETAAAILDRIGRMPLPPYIRRDKENDPRDQTDRDRYQTVFARAPGAVAAPTAALHFTEPLLAELSAMGVTRTFVTLHVGMGTFKPVTVPTLETHAMHSEPYQISAESAEELNRVKAEGRRIIAVGTTSARVLESQPEESFVARQDETRLLIYPPYQWKHVSALLTNFHLPRSTLIALVAAFVGLDTQRKIYQTAIAEQYRFFSYGDAMLLE